MTIEPPAPRRRWQLGLRTTILLVVVVALGLNLARDRRALRRLAPEAARATFLRRRATLDATGPRQVASKNLAMSWGPDQSWEGNLPPGGRYRLCLATRVGRFEDRPANFQSATLEPGRHLLSLDEQRIGTGWRLIATWNRVDRLLADETGDWAANGSWTGGMMDSPHATLGQAITLVDRKNGRAPGPWPPNSPTPIPEVPGVRLWIETEPE